MLDNKPQSTNGMYFVDNDYHIIAINRTANDWYPNAKVGDFCFEAFSLQNTPCEACPLKHEHILFYSDPRKEWIESTVTEVDFPPHGNCYCIQFKRQKQQGGVKKEYLRLNKLDEYIIELYGASTGKECVLAAYQEPGSPLFYANEHMISLLGYRDADELMQATGGLVDKLIHPDDFHQVQNNIYVTYEMNSHFEFNFRIRKKDNSWAPVVCKGKTIETPNGHRAAICVCTDMSIFMALQENLILQNNEYQKKELLFETIAQNMPSGYHRCSISDGFVLSFISDSFLDIVGWTREELKSQLNNRFINLVAPEDRERFMSLEPVLVRNGRVDAVYRLLRKDGSRRWVKDATVRVEQNGSAFYQCTLADITEYVEQINAEKYRAEESSRAKSRFLFNLSHDIRTPMNAIQGFTQIMKKNPDNKQTLMDTLTKIETSSDTLSKLLSDVLELSRIESGKDDVNLSTTDLYDFTERLKTMFEHEIKASDIDFVMSTEIQDRYVWMDDLKLTQVGMNMLSNAKKFTPPGGKIEFGVKQLPCEDDEYGLYHLFVQDSGIGMSEEFQRRAFEQFERERTSTDSGKMGSGLGMAIIKNLVELMGGTCTLESKLGEGTTISAIIKLRISSKKQENLPTPTSTNVDFSQKRILLVEDNAFNREIGRFVLENMGFIVEEAEDGSIAVNMLLSASSGYYDAILMDIQMPIMDGYKATEEIRRIGNKELSTIPIIAMTANAFQEDKEHCLSVGMNGHIAKPIDVNTLAKELSLIFSIPSNQP